MFPYKRVAVIGGGGFKGSRLALRLCDMGVRVICLVKEKNYKTQPEILARTSVVIGDVRDYDCVRYLFSRYEVDLVFHLAAITILQQAQQDPMTAISINVMGTANVLQAARACKVRKVVYVSSDKSYGHHEQLPYLETHPFHVDDIYSTSKAAADLLSRSFQHNYPEMDISITRAGNTIGEADLNMSRIVPRTTLRCLSGLPPIIHIGSENNKREYLYVDDVISAYLLVAEKGGKGEAYNVGGTDALTTVQMAKLISDETGYYGEPKFLKRTFVEVKNQSLCADKLKSLGWSPKFTLKEGLKRTVAWYRDNLSKIPPGEFCNVLEEDEVSLLENLRVKFGAR